MGEQAHWLILRVLIGHPLRIADDILALGIEAYCPRFKRRRYHAFDRSRAIDVVSPLFPGYLFTAEPFDVDRINFRPVRTRFMCRDGADGESHYLMATPTEMARIREAEQRADNAWQTSIDEMVRALAAKKVKSRFVNLGEFKRLRQVAE